MAGTKRKATDDAMSAASSSSSAPEQPAQERNAVIDQLPAPRQPSQDGKDVIFPILTDDDHAWIRASPTVLRHLIFGYAAPRIAPAVFRELVSVQHMPADARERMRYLGSPSFLFWEGSCDCDTYAPWKFLAIAKRCVDGDDFSLFVWANEWLRPFLRLPSTRCFSCSETCSSDCRCFILEIPCSECGCHNRRVVERRLPIPVAENAFPALTTEYVASALLDYACKLNRTEFALALVRHGPINELMPSFSKAVQYNQPEVMIALVDTVVDTSPAGTDVFEGGLVRGDLFRYAIQAIDATTERATIGALTQLLQRSSSPVQHHCHSILLDDVDDTIKEMEDDLPENEAFERLVRLDAIFPFPPGKWMALLGAILDGRVESPAHRAWVARRAKAALCPVLDVLAAGSNEPASAFLRSG